VVSVELFLEANPIGAAILGVINYPVKALPDNFLLVPTASTPSKC
jgi:hypothetical protein